MRPTYLRGAKLPMLRKKICFLLALGIFALSFNSVAQTSTRRGLHFIFDGSASMCGYLRAADPNRVLLTLMRRASELKDSERNNRVFLIKQQGQTPSAARDIIEAPPNFQSLAASASGVAPISCEPFTGSDSNMDLLFAEMPNPARSYVLISDMQLDERALESFVDQFRKWVRNSPKNDFSTVGIASFSAPFVGTYYPTVIKGHYANLPQFQRPLHVIWFLNGADDNEALRSLFQDLGVGRSGSMLYGLQVLPYESENSATWFKTPTPMGRIDNFFSQPAISFEVINRNETILSNCIQARLNGNTLKIEAEPRCQDRKPIFDGVDAITLNLTLVPGNGIAVEVPQSVIRFNAAKLTLNLRRDTARQFDVPITLKRNAQTLNATKYEALNLDSDECQVGRRKVESSWEAECARRLTNKTYRYSALIRKMSARAADVRSRDVNAVVIPLKVQFTY